MSNENKPATALTALSVLPVGTRGVELDSLENIFRFAKCIAASPFAPKGFESPESIVVAIQFGLEIGLSPMAALQNIAVINGRPGIYGDAALALVRASGVCESYSQTVTGDGDARTATVVSKRRDATPITSTFSVADAKKAGLWGKQGPWSNYPDRMLLFRARGFNLRDNFGDVLKGLHTTEELRDEPVERVIEAREITKPVIDVSKSEPPKPGAEPAQPKEDPKPRARKAAAAPEPQDPAPTRSASEPLPHERLAFALQEAGCTAAEAMAVLVSQKLAKPGWMLADLPDQMIAALGNFSSLVGEIAKARGGAK